MKHSHSFVSYGTLSLIGTKASRDLSGKVPPATTIRRYQIQVHVNDLDAALMRVKQSGGKVLQPITETPQRERVFQCVDPEGNLIEVAEHR